MNPENEAQAVASSRIQATRWHLIYQSCIQVAQSCLSVMTNEENIRTGLDAVGQVFQEANDNVVNFRGLAKAVVHGGASSREDANS